MIRAIVYSNPGCMPCKFVKAQLTKIGIEYEERSAEEHNEFIHTAMNTHNLAPAAPFVEIAIDNESHFFTGNSVGNLEAIAYLAKET